MFHFGVSRSTEAEFREKTELVADDPVGKELSAVKNERLFRGGTPYQGPILNLFQLEMSAKQRYPDVFGAWPAYDDGPYPEIPADEWLFDRDRVAAVVTGEAIGANE